MALPSAHDAADDVDYPHDLLLRVQAEKLLCREIQQLLDYRFVESIIRDDQLPVRPYTKLADVHMAG